MPAQKSAKPVKSPTKPAAQAEKKAPVETKKSAAKPAAKPAAKTATPPATKAKTVPASKSPAAEELKTAKAVTEAVEPAKKKPGRPPKAAAAGVPVLCWTVNAPEVADALFARGVTSVFADRIDLLIGR